MTVSTSNSLTPDEYAKPKEVRRQLKLLMGVVNSLEAMLKEVINEESTKHNQKFVTRVCELANDATDFIYASLRTGQYDPEPEGLMKLVHEVKQLKVPHKISDRIQEHNYKGQVINEIDPVAEFSVPRAQVGPLSWGILCKKIKHTSALLHHIPTVR